MAKFIFSNVIGSFVFDEKYALFDEVLFKDIGQYNDKKAYEGKLMRKHGNLAIPEGNDLYSILMFFKDKKYFAQLYKGNIELTRQSIRNSVSTDLLIIQTISCMEEADKTINLLAKRLREWYYLYSPEISNKIESHERFASEITKTTKKELLKELNVDEKDVMGAELKDKDVSAMLLLASQINSLCNLKKGYEDYLKELEKEACPNFMEVAGATIAAKLLAHAGSLKRLVEMPSSTIQILGAEKALFRHMKNKKRNLPPKYGILHEHQLIQKSRDEMHGKAARALADKLSIAVKIDYFKGKFIGDTLKKRLVEKFNIQY